MGNDRNQGMVVITNYFGIHQAPRGSDPCPQGMFTVQMSCIFVTRCPFVCVICSLIYIYIL